MIARVRDRISEYWYDILVWTVVLVLVCSCASEPVACKEAPSCNKALSECSSDLGECSSMLQECMERL